MKTVYLTRDYVYRPHWKRQVLFKRGETYRRVLEAAARQIERAEAGLVLPDDMTATDARDAWRRRR